MLSNIADPSLLIEEEKEEAADLNKVEEAGEEERRSRKGKVEETKKRKEGEEGSVEELKAKDLQKIIKECMRNPMDSHSTRMSLYNSS